MVSIEDVLLKRTSVRRYERKQIEPEKLEFIYEAIRNVATSYNGQQFSVIAIDDVATKERLYEITNQKQIKTSALFLVFCVDFHKIKVAARAKKLDYAPFENTIDGFTVGVVDATLAMQTAATAAQSLGLGCCFIGYTRTADPEQIAEVLRLPQGVCVVCGLSIGYPSETPDQKPKQPQSLVIHKNHYRTDDMSGELLAYDELISDYNHTRSGTTSTNDWISHITNYYAIAVKRQQMGYLHDQGFLINVTDHSNKKV